MADPVSLAVIGMGAAAAGGGVSALGSLFSGQAQKNMYNYQAGVARANAVVAKQDAAYALASGEVEAQQSGMKTRFQEGATKVGIAAGNIDTSTGSAGKVIASETEIGQENEAVIRANAAKKAYGFEVGAAEDVAQAGAYTVAGETSVTAGDIGAVSSVLGAAGNVSSKWLQASQAFGTPDANVNPDSAAGQVAYSSSIYGG